MCMCVLLEAGGCGAAGIVGISCALFSAAHLHHLYQTLRLRGPVARTTVVASAGRCITICGATSLSSAVPCLVFQMCYTYVFGSLAVFLFLRTRKLSAPASRFTSRPPFSPS